MELSSEDSFRLNVLLANKPQAIRIDESRLMVYGLSPWGLGSYIGAVGKIFTPAMSFIFLMKTLAFSLAVALLPAGLAKANELQAFTRLIALLLLVEAVSLVGNYA